MEAALSGAGREDATAWLETKLKFKDFYLSPVTWHGSDMLVWQKAT